MKLIRTATMIGGLLCLATGMWAQSQEGRISGRVIDQSGAVVVKATVTIQNTETGVKRGLLTNSAGEYVAPNLSPGIYSVSVSAPTFKTVERKGIRLEVATDVRIDLALQPGQVSEVLVVTGEQSLVETLNDTLGGTITNKAINELPLQGRDFQNLLELRPGIQRTPGGGFHSVTSNGNRLEDNNYIVDGTDDNDVYYGDTVINGAGVQGTPASHLPLDAIQEFNTQENQSADYGFKPGAVINIGLKSGSNDFHGTSYYFHRNSAFDARNWFNPAPEPASALLLHEYGASAGGPIVKDKWFIFGNYEGVRHKVGNPYLATSPVTESLVGKTLPEGTVPEDLSIYDAQVQAGCPDSPTCNPVSYEMAKLFLPNPGFTANAFDPTLINFDFNNTNREDNFIIKSDYHLSQKHVITGRYFFASSLQTEEDTSPLRPDWLSVADTRAQVMGVNWTWVPNSRWVNEARLGYNRSSQSLYPVDHNRSPESYGLNTGVTDPRLFGFPRISISPFDYMGGNYNWPLLTTPNQTFQLVDNVSLTRGAHNIRFGGEFRHGGTDNFRARYGRGRIDFSALEDFVGGNVYRGRVLTGDPGRDVSLTSFGGFVQDEWRIRPRVTLNLGLRYDVTLPIKDAHDRLANFYPDRGIVQVGQGISSPYPTDWKDFSPRLGVAWNLFGTGKTVLRFGGAIIYEQPSIRVFVDRGGLNENPSGAIVQGVQNKGNIQVFNRTVGSFTFDPNTPWFDTSAGGSCYYNSPDDYNACDLFGVSPKLRTPYVGSWNFNLQQELSKSTVLQIGYVGNRGIKLYSHRDINQSIPALSADCYYNSPYDLTTCEQLTRPMVLNCPPSIGNGLGGPCQPYVGYGNYLENKANSIYHGLQATVTQKAFRGLNFMAGYTWAHAIDVGTSNRGAYPQDSTNFNAERGNGDYDIRHRFTLAVTYDVPTIKAPLQLGQGWTVTSIVNLQGGEPYNFYDSYNDISFTGEALDRWNFAGNPGDVHWSAKAPLPYFPDGTSNPACLAQATTDGLLANLAYYGCFQQGSAVITPPADGTFGNMRRNIFRGPAFHNWDMSVTKRFKLTEKVNLQLRGEFFNILNHANFDWLTLATDLSDATSGANDVALARATPDVGASNPVVGSGGSRHVQLGAKIIW
jgi:hypothetical protein